MYTIFKTVHSIAAYFTLFFLLAAVIYAFYGWITKKPFSKRSKIIFIIGLIATHLQFIFGIVLYFVSPLGISNVSGTMMKSASLRLYALEHPFMMLISIFLITIGYAKSKRAVDENSKHKTVALFYGISFILILTRLPWNSWLS
ncbi:hypothetical protein [Flavobacterium johnsoniae]|uniref:Cytochrome B n=1 Tax=Flavobacterium johnsoniae TaxID=986 RepID=A0A1M5QUL9_FLAJO|nr:hypothetical protein [Flavobacterium johnsoniae]SHH17566.1 hypothetical protein SAMN05444388_107167 [Flavobacterium johnsoniae]